MNPSHPKAIEAAAVAEKRAEARAHMKKFVAAMHEKGVRFIEITPTPLRDIDDKSPMPGRMTIAYIATGRNMVVVSTAICHPQDTFDKLSGRALAGSAMIGGHSIQLRRPSYYPNNRMWLQTKFTELYE